VLSTFVFIGGVLLAFMNAGISNKRESA